MESKQGFNACLRCKSRKIKCDREMPKCTNCEKAGTPCLTNDSATGRQVPRSYLNHLETRVQQLEHELEVSRKYVYASSITKWVPESLMPYHEAGSGFEMASQFASILQTNLGQAKERLEHTGPVTTSTPREQPPKPSDPLSLPADLPPKREAESMVRWYFEQCNSTFPVLHREQFIHYYFEPIYGPISPGLQLCTKFTTHKLACSAMEPGPGTFYRKWVSSTTSAPDARIQTCLYFMYIVMALGTVTNFANEPAVISRGVDYFSAALVYYSAASASPLPDLFTSSRGDQYRSLQAVLLLSLYRIMKPASPSAWYAVGDAMRMCIDLGLHNEQRAKLSEDAFTVDMRRRLFWTAYLMDRMVSINMGRPVCIGDDYIMCEWPSLVDDSWLTPAIAAPKYDAQEGARENLVAPSLDNASASASATSASASNVSTTVPAIVPAGAPTSGITPPLGTNSSAPTSSATAASTSPVPIAPNVVKSKLEKSKFQPSDRPSYKWVFHTMLRLRQIQHRIKFELYDRVHCLDVEQSRAKRTQLANELEEWYATTPWDKSTFNFDWNTDMFEVNYLYTRFLLFRNSRAIPDPNAEESRSLIDAAIKMLTIYIKFGEINYLVYQWGAVHNILQAATSCMYAMFRTNCLNNTYDFTEFESIMTQVLTVVDKLRISSEVASTYYEPLSRMFTVTMDFLHDSLPRKRVKTEEDATLPPLQPQPQHPPHPQHAPQQPHPQHAPQQPHPQHMAYLQAPPPPSLQNPSMQAPLQAPPQMHLQPGPQPMGVPFMVQEGPYQRMVVPQLFPGQFHHLILPSHVQQSPHQQQSQSQRYIPQFAMQSSPNPLTQHSQASSAPAQPSTPSPVQPSPIPQIAPQNYQQILPPLTSIQPVMSATEPGDKQDMSRKRSEPDEARMKGMFDNVADVFDSDLLSVSGFREQKKA